MSTTKAQTKTSKEDFLKNEHDSLVDAQSQKSSSDPLTHLFVTRRPVIKCVCDWPVYDVDDPICRWQVFLEDGVHSSGVVHQDEPLQKQGRNETTRETISPFLWT